MLGRVLHPARGLRAPTKRGPSEGGWETRHQSSFIWGGRGGPSQSAAFPNPTAAHTRLYLFYSGEEPHHSKAPTSLLPGHCKGSGLGREASHTTSPLSPEPGKDHPSSLHPQDEHRGTRLHATRVDHHPQHPKGQGCVSSVPPRSDSRVGGGAHNTTDYSKLQLGVSRKTKNQRQRGLKNTTAGPASSSGVPRHRD